MCGYMYGVWVHVWSVGTCMGCGYMCGAWVHVWGVGTCVECGYMCGVWVRVGCGYMYGVWVHVWGAHVFVHGYIDCHEYTTRSVSFFTGAGLVLPGAVLF